MKCTCTCASAKIFAKAIQTLSKVGAELLIDANKDGLQLRSFNSTQSSVIIFNLKKAFFDTYEYESSLETYYKIGIKGCLQVFRNMKQVEQCVITLDGVPSKLHVQLFCRLETIRNTVVNIMEEENLKIEAEPDDTYHMIIGSCKIFSDISHNFNTAEQEVTLEAERDHVVVKNYMERTSVHERFMRSQLKLNRSEFEKYDVRSRSSATFSLKELKAFLAFAEVLNASVVLKFAGGGSPIFFNAKNCEELECILITSTISPEDVTFDENASPVVGVDTVIEKRRRTPNESASLSRAAKSRRCTIADDATLSNTTSAFQFNGSDVSDDDERARNDYVNPTQVSIQSSERLIDPPANSVTDDSMMHELSCQSEANDVDKFLKGSLPNRHRDVNNIFSRCFGTVEIPSIPSSQILADDTINKKQQQP